MAIPIRAIPVLEGAVANRFEQEARRAENERETIAFSREEKDNFREILAKARF